MQHYFSLHDFDTVPHNVTTGLTLKIGTPTATSDVQFGHSFYYDTLVSVSTLVTVTLTASTTTTLYSTSITPTTFNVLQVDHVLTFTHTKTVSADISFGIQVQVASGSNYSIGSGCS
jgi:hypothetical protein